jgi:hypothetical protein
MTTSSRSLKRWNIKSNACLLAPGLAPGNGITNLNGGTIMISFLFHHGEHNGLQTSSFTIFSPPIAFP